MQTYQNSANLLFTKMISPAISIWEKTVPLRNTNESEDLTQEIKLFLPFLAPTPPSYIMDLKMNICGNKHNISNNLTHMHTHTYTVLR